MKVTLVTDYYLNSKLHKAGSEVEVSESTAATMAAKGAIQTAKPAGRRATRPRRNPGDGQPDATVPPAEAQQPPQTTPETTQPETITQ